MKKILFYFLLCSSILFAKSSVWKIQKNENTVYIGGTIHILKKTDYPLPKEYEKAYNQADKLYLETNLDAIMQADFQKALFSKMLLKNGKKLSTLLNKQTYKRLGEFVSIYSINLNDFDKFKPAMIYLTLTIAELQRIGVDTLGVDYYFQNKAIHEQKALGELESVEEQLNYISTIGEGNENKFINNALDDFEKTRELVEKVTVSWRKGDVDTLHKVFIENMKNNYPRIYNNLLVKRNNNWLPTIKSMFKDKQIEFVLVGIGHLLGEKGLLQQLEKAGYTVEHLK